MSRLSDLQHSFFSYLLGRDSDFVAQVRDQGRVSAGTRAEIYRNGYRLRLRDAINTDHEILGYYLGDELFDRMVDGYIDRYPSHSTTLRLFAEHLPDFLRENQPFSGHPVLAELAAFERRLLFAFDAPDGPRESAGALQALPADRWPSMRFRFHPSMQFFPARWNSVEIWQALKAEQEPPVAVSQQPRQWLLWRNKERITEFRLLEVYEFEVLQAALAGHDLAVLCERLAEWYAPEQVGHEALGLMRTWLSQGVLQQIVTDRAKSTNQNQ